MAQFWANADAGMCHYWAAVVDETGDPLGEEDRQRRLGNPDGAVVSRAASVWEKSRSAISAGTSVQCMGDGGRRMACGLVRPAQAGSSGEARASSSELLPEEGDDLITGTYRGMTLLVHEMCRDDAVGAPDDVAEEGRRVRVRCISGKNAAVERFAE